MIRYVFELLNVARSPEEVRALFDVISPNSLLKKASAPTIASTVRNYYSPKANKKRGSS